MSQTNYEERKRAKIDRLEERAERAEGRSEQLHKESSDMFDAIPFGQPILVGHHSEKADRSYRNRASRKMDRAIEESDKGKHYRSRAAAADSNRKISSDDPEAVQKLKAKIESAEKYQETVKAANKIIRRKPKNEETPEKLTELAKLLHKEDFECKQLFKPDFCGRVGFASYLTTNNNANIRRMKQRIEELQASEGQETKETDEGICKVVENVEENRIQLVFDGKPSDKVRAVLKSNGFRWSRYNMAWQRHLNDAGRWAVKRTLATLNPERT